jgi:hypothetical protein
MDAPAASVAINGQADLGIPRRVFDRSLQDQEIRAQLGDGENAAVEPKLHSYLGGMMMHWFTWGSHG